MKKLIIELTKPGGIGYPGYQDYLMGEGGNDVLHADEETNLAGLESLRDFGGAGVEDKIGDMLFGGAGNDSLAGSNRHDVMLGQWKKVSPGGTAANDVQWRAAA